MIDVPDHIARYRVEGVLGRGAMGVVYRAHDPEIDRRVAIKLIRADLLDGGDRADYLARFRREAQAAGRCAHPNIVTIYDFAVHEGNPFLAMEFVDGVSLSQARQRGAVFEPDDTVMVVLQVLEALGAAHALGVVHRDVKPANILLVNGNRVKVTDFGISRFDTSGLTQDASVIGTPSYMSPEQCRGDAVDGRSDLFSTAVVLYELLCGERPFPGRDFGEVMRRLLNDPPPNLRERCVGVTPAIQAVVERALAKSPLERFATAADMAAALRGAQGNVSRLADRTIVVPQLPAAEVGPSTGMTGIFDSAMLATLERRLAQHVGPIAGYLVRDAVGRAANVEALCDSLAGHIERRGERETFRAAALAQLRHGRSGTSIGTARARVIPPEELERARKELATFIGPVAGLLVKRGAAASVSPADLWQRLSLHIEREPDRKAFLARRRP